MPAKKILILGYGIDGKRTEAVSINTLKLQRLLRSMNFSVEILNIGYPNPVFFSGRNMFDAVLRFSSIRHQTIEYIRSQKFSVVIDVFVLPLSSVIFTFPIMSALPNVKFIKEIHNDFGRSPQLHLESLIRLLANNRYVFQSVTTKFDHFFTRNKYLAKKYQLPYLANSLEILSTARKPQKSNQIRVGYLGHPLPKKGVYEFPILFSLLSEKIKSGITFNFAFSQIGSSASIQQEIQSSAKKYRVEVAFAGKISPAKFFREQDFYILPIHDQFGSVSTPNTVLEAMEAGAIPIVTDIPSLEGIVESGKNGLLLANFHASQIAKTLEAVLYDTVLQTKMRRSARAKILAEHSQQTIQKTLRKIL